MDWNDIDKFIKKARLRDYETEEEAQKTVDTINSFDPPWSCPIVKDNCAGHGLKIDSQPDIKPCVCFYPAWVYYDVHSKKHKVLGYYCTAYQLFGPEV